MSSCRIQQKLGVVALPYTSWHSEEEREEAQVSRDQPKLVTRSLAQLILAAIWPKARVGHRGLLTLLLRVPRSPRCHRFEEVIFFRVSFFSSRQRRDSPSEWFLAVSGLCHFAIISTLDFGPSSTGLGWTVGAIKINLKDP